MAKRSSSTSQISFAVPKRVAKALKEVPAGKRQVRVFGQVKKGKLVLDKKGLAKFSKKIPTPTTWFVALNAPFKTGAPTGSL